MYSNIVTLSNQVNSNISKTNTLSNTVQSFSNDVYSKTFKLSSSNMYVQSNVYIGFNSIPASLNVYGQIISYNDTNWSQGGIRFQSVSGCNDSGIAQGSNGALRFLAPSNDGSNGFQWINSARNAVIMQLDNTGNINCYGDMIAFNTSISDSNYKKDVYLLSNYGECLSNLRPVSFTWAHNTPIKEKAGTWDIGLIAQDVALAFPLAHRTSDFLGSNVEIVRYEKFIPILLAACKDYQDRIAILEEKVNSLLNSRI